MDYNFEARRIVRKKEYEKWLVTTTYNSNDISFDRLYIFFDNNNCEVLLFNENDTIHNNENYILLIESLYHDIGIMEDDELIHDFKIVTIPLEIKNNDNKIDDYIHNYLNNLGKNNIL